jgi:hypothetical protein
MADYWPELKVVLTSSRLDSGKATLLAVRCEREFEWVKSTLTHIDPSRAPGAGAMPLTPSPVIGQRLLQPLSALALVWIGELNVRPA